MRRLLPPPPAEDGEAAEVVDPVQLVWSDRRPAAADRPWVLANMISSVDGAATLEGTSGALGSPADKAMFSALRQVPDVILVASGTVQAEQYRPPSPPAEVRARREAAGLTPVPRLAIVTGHLNLDLDGPLFTDTATRPILLTVEAVPEARRQAAGAVADVLVAGQGRVQLDQALHLLHQQGIAVVLCEGGPSLLGQLAGADVLDELCLTVSPLLVGGDELRIVRGAAEATVRRPLVLDRVLEEDSMLFLRYLRAPA